MSKGVMSFDSFFDEAGTFNEVPEEDAENDTYDYEFNEDALWDDDYDWHAPTAHHEDMNEVNPHLVESVEHDMGHLPSLADLIERASEKPMHPMTVEEHLAADTYLKAVEEQALHDLVPLLPTYVAEHVEHHPLPEVEFANSDGAVEEIVGHVIHHDEPAIMAEEEAEMEDHARDENRDGVDNVNTFSEQDFMNYVIKLVI